MNYLFNTSFGLQLNSDQVVREIIDFMAADLRRNYKIIIGTDSDKAPDKTADFVTAIVVHRVGNGGRYFWRRLTASETANGSQNENSGRKKYFTLRDRITEEVLISLETAKEILQRLKRNTLPIDWDFEIHVDIGQNGETKTMIQELVGMIRANNFEAKTKPDSYAASKVADRHI